MADGPSAAKKTKTGDLPECPYGVKCYRKNPQHLKDFSHTGPVVDDRTGSSTDSSGAITTLTTTQSSSTPPPCKYGGKCYRKNLMHFAEFSHPTKSDNKSGDSGGDSDTDVISSDDEKDKKKDVGSDILSRGMSLIKNYSKMSEVERKELIKKAFEVKKKLEDELKQTKKQVEEKEKELNKLQSQVNTGLLLVEGEKEALEGTEMKTFTLAAERAHKENSAEQIHFRLAESQFYRLLSGSCCSNYSLHKVEYVVNPKIVKHFKQSRVDLKKLRGEDQSYPVLAFHGTKEVNISKICENGFTAPGESGFAMRTDTGWYGAGVYFSEYPAYSMSYIQGSTKLLLCQVLPGKAYQCTKIINGAKLQKAYDSHTSPCQKELVIFNSHHILPSYIVHYKTGAGDFKYISPAVAADTNSCLEKYKKSQMTPGSKIFKGYNILFSGKLCTKQADLVNLAKNHGSGKATLGNCNLLVTTQDEMNANTNKVQAASNKNIPIVSEDYLYDCILGKNLLDITADYEFE